MRRPGDDDGAAEDRSETDGMLLRARLGAHAQQSDFSGVGLKWLQALVSTWPYRCGHAKPQLKSGKVSGCVWVSVALHGQ